MAAKNFIIFVADGLRNSAVNATDAPTLYSIRQQGVNFANSHSLFPTFTTPNASAIATGHYLGDTGDFSNTIDPTGFPVANGGNGGSLTPFVENNAVLSDIDEKFPGNNFLDEESLLAYARAAGYSTGAVGKLGPVAIQDVTQINRVGDTSTTFNGSIPTPQTVIIDDRTGAAASTVTGSPAAVPLSQDITNRLNAAGLGTTTPGRGANGVSGNNTTAGTTVANTVQQQFFIDATTKAVLPEFQANGKPFGLVYWSRDPDGTQHNQGDSLNSLTPGIDGPTSKAAIKNADNNLAQILAYLKSTGLDKTTDVFVTADHGFSTISKQAIDAQGDKTNSYAAKQSYTDTNAGFLPVGFVAIDLAHDLGQPLYDPDNNTIKPLDINNIQYAAVDATKGQHPVSGDGVIGGTGKVLNGKSDGNVVVAANGGSDLIYLPNNDKTLAQQIVNLLSSYDYISGVYTNDALGPIAGALPLSSVGLKGSALTQTPAIFVNFKTFTTDPTNPNYNEVEIADTGLQQGQGMHGNFGRGDTFNNMEAIGPDFKSGYTDYAPVGNQDVAPTLARVLGFNLPSTGDLKGRTISEALVGGADSVPFTTGTMMSTAATNGQQTILNYQAVGSSQYFTQSGFAGRTVGLTTATPTITVGKNNSLNTDTNGFGSLQFTLNNQTPYNELGVFLTDDAQGTINGITPGSSGYTQAALKRAEVLFSALPSDSVLGITKQSAQRILGLPQGANVGFYQVVNNTSNKVLSDLASGNTSDTVYLNTPGANSGGTNHLSASNSSSGTQFNWDNGASFTVQAQPANAQASADNNPVNLLIDSGQASGANATTLNLTAEANYHDFVGWYKVADAKGTVVSNGQTFTPGQAGYAQAAINQALSNLTLGTGNFTGSSYVRSAASTNTSIAGGGGLLAPFLIANGDTGSFLSKNGNDDPNNGNAQNGNNPLAYFAFTGANPDKLDHIRGIGGNRIAFEDLFNYGDRDFNDAILQINATKPLITSAIAV